MKDGSYYYFNANLSWYLHDNTPSSQNSASYTSPRGERFLRPSPSAISQYNPTYFIGIDADSRREQIFYQDANGRILRAFRKFAGDTENLRRFNVRTTRGGDGEEVFSFDVGGGGEWQNRLEGRDRVARRLDFLPGVVGERGRGVREYVEAEDDVVFVKTERVYNPFVDLYDA